MTPSRLQKITAIANDARGDPATRAVAAAILKRYAKQAEPKEFKPRPDPRVHGLRQDQQYQRYVYADLSQWDKTKAGNPTYIIYHNGISYRIVLFKHKRGDTHGWMRINTYTDESVFSDRFGTIGEAQDNAWTSTMTL